jgi:hypothetical protein
VSAGVPGEGDALAGLVSRVAALDDEPVGGHPQVLEEVHRGLVAELEALAGAGTGARRQR